MTRDRVRLWRLRFARRWKFLVGVSVTTTALAAACQRFDWAGMRGSEDSAYDAGLANMTKWTARPEHAKDVVMLWIDDASLQSVAANPSMREAYGNWPWSRNVWARVFTQLDEDGARAIVFDAVMSEAGGGSTDQQLADAIASIHTPVYLGFATVAGHAGRVLPHVDAVNVIDPPATPTPAPAATASDDTFPGSDDATFPGDAAAASGPGDADIARALAFPVTTSGGLALAPLLDGADEKHPIPPIAPLIPVLRGAGLVEMEADDDGKLRRTRFAWTDGANAYATLPLAVVADLDRADHVELAPGRLTIGAHRIAINPGGDAAIDYRGTVDDVFEAHPVISVLDQSADLHATPPKKPALSPDVFRGKVVVIGGRALGTADIKSTPFESGVSGAVKQAATIQNLLDDRMIVDAPFWISLLVTFVVSLIAVSVVTIFHSIWLEIAWPFALGWGFYLVTGLLLVHGQVHVLSAMPAWAASYGAIFIAVTNHVWKDKHRERVRETFFKHVDPHLLEELVELDRLPRLAGEHRELTLLVTDVRHFNELSSHYAKDPHGLVKLMNDYLGRITKVLLHEGGCLSKYLGDKAIVLFGAPMPQEDHALRACRAALHVIHEVEHLQSTLPEHERRHVHTRIAIHSGEMFVGNFGTEKLVDYSVVGEGMSATAELVDVNSAWSTSIAISDRVRREAGDAIVARELERRVLPGEPEEPVWELVGLKGALSQPKQEVISLYDLALKAMRGARFEEARAALKQALARDPQDGPSKALLARIDAAGSSLPKQEEGR